MLKAQGRDVSRAMMKGCQKRKANLEAKLQKVDVYKRQADHHALLPTENLPSELDADHRIVYEMVAGRILETFSGACVKENTSITLQSPGHDFTARGSIMVETVWRAVLNEPVEEKEEDMTLLQMCIRDRLYSVSFFINGFDSRV